MYLHWLSPAQRLITNNNMLLPPPGQLTSFFITNQRTGVPDQVHWSDSRKLESNNDSHKPVHWTIGNMLKVITIH